MISFKKPKRNLRIRGTTEDDVDENEQLDTFSSTAERPIKVKTKKPVHQPLLSFDEDWNEGDDGEVFKVKKSTQSKKIKKLLEKERKKKKDKPDCMGGNSSEKLSQPLLEDDVIIKLKNTFILNGREAETAVPEGVSSDEDDTITSPRFIKQTDSVKLLLKKGKIPDAATIHAARKQRQHVREMGGEIISTAEEVSRHDSKSRLVREDDNDASDGEEERINMAAINTGVEDRLRRKAEFDAAQELGYAESDKGEDEEWEAQQIRKGVTGAQIAAVQQESLYYQQYLSNGGVAAPTPAEMMVSAASLPVDPTSLTVASSDPAAQPYMVFPPLPSTGSVEPNEVFKKIKDRLTDLKEVHRRHVLDFNAAQDEIDSLKAEIDKIKTEAPRLAEKFRFYQDLRGYVTDLVECLDEKIVIVGLLEQRVESQSSKRISEYICRRRQDVMDQAQELAPSSQKVGASSRTEALTRRVAEREGRRIRRQRARELRGVAGHVEGMSSDEEVTEAEALTVRAQKDVIEQDARHVFEDVLDEFATVAGILTRFEAWRNTDMSAYTEAYVSLCLPKLLGPLIRLKLLFWNPILQGCGSELERSAWFANLLLFGLELSETEDSLRADPDAQLVPRIVERIILPKLTQLTSSCWDPLSSSQTVSLVGLVTKLIQDYPTLTSKSKTLTLFFEVVIAKMKDAVDNDVYIPIYPHQRMSESKVCNFFMRQCTVAVKLLGNLARWQGLLSDSILTSVALDSVLNRYLMCALRTCQPLQGAQLCQMIGNVLPRIWLQKCIHPPQLIQFLNQAKLLAKGLDIDKPVERDAFERMSCILKVAS